MEHTITPDSGLGLSEQVRHLGQMLAELDTLQRRTDAVQITPGEVVYRDQHDVFHHVTIGAVLSAYSCSAHYARRLDGLLSLPIMDILEDDSLFDSWRKAFMRKTLGEALIAFLDIEAGYLEAKGRYAEWRRKYDRYMAKTEAFLAAQDDRVRASMMRKPPSKGQVSLIRYTCACLQLEFPALSTCWAAYEWLKDVGANPRYREVRP